MPSRAPADPPDPAHPSFAGRHYYPVALEAHVPGFVAAVVVSTLAILCMGFVVASIVPTARS